MLIYLVRPCAVAGQLPSETGSGERKLWCNSWSGWNHIWVAKLKIILKVDN